MPMPKWWNDSGIYAPPDNNLNDGDPRIHLVSPGVYTIQIYKVGQGWLDIFPRLDANSVVPAVNLSNLFVLPDIALTSFAVAQQTLPFNVSNTDADVLADTLLQAAVTAG